MDEKCLICQESHNPETYVFLEEIMDKFQNLMEGYEFDVNSARNALICKNCVNKIETFFDFKSSFIEKEDELLNYVDNHHTVDLCAMLVTRGTLQKGHYQDPFRVCRICFKTSEGGNFKQIRTSGSYITKLTTCYPDFDIFLTGTTYICPECENEILKFFHFHTSCFKAIKRVTISEAPLSLDMTSLTKERNNLKAEAENIKKSCSPIPGKSKRGRPRKVEKCYVDQLKKIGKINEYISKEEIERILQKANAREFNYSYECQVCPGIFDSLESLLKHMRFHETQRNFICWKCGALYPYLHLLRPHFNKHGIDIFKIVAQEKEKSDDEIRIKQRTWRPYVKTKRIHKNKDTLQHIECQLCLKTFCSLSSFQKDIEAHEKVKKFHCLKCVYTTTAITDIQKHLATSHKIPNLYKILHFKCTQKNLSPITCKDSIAGDETRANTTEENALPITCKDSIAVDETRANTTEENTLPITCKDSIAVDETRANMREENALPITNNRKYCCGHCSGIFFNLNELEDHTCTPQATKSDVENPLKNKPENGCYSAANNLATIQRHVLNQSVEDDYECSFCLASFKTLKALDNHECPGDEDSSLYTTNDRNLKCSTCILEFESRAALAAHSCSKFCLTIDSNSGIDSTENVNENSEQFELVTKKVDQFDCPNCSTKFESCIDILMHSCDISTPTSECSKFLEKMEEQFHCSHCNAPFDTLDNLNLHNCLEGSSSKPEAFPGEQTYEDVNNSFKMEIDEHFANGMSPNVQENGDRQSVTIESSGMHCEYGKTEMANDKDIGKSDPVKTSVKEKPSEKEVVNRIANMFGIQIMEGANRKRQDMREEFCVGCNFKAPKKKDLLIHINYCEQVKKCSYCPYRTNESQELELHSYLAHDVIIYACSNCRFVTSMEENFESHMSIHSGVVKNESEKENCFEEELNEKKCFEFGDKIDIKDENINESAHVKQKCNDGNDETSKIGYIGNCSYGVSNENTGNTVNATTNGRTSLSRKPNGDSSLTRIISEEVSRNADVIDINSDSDNEFIESSQDRAVVIGESRKVDHDEASDLISQGTPVVKNSYLLGLHIDASDVKSDFEITKAETAVVPSSHSSNVTANNISIAIDSDGEESDNDCVIMSNEANQPLSETFSQTSKNLPGLSSEHSSDSNIIKRPTNAFDCFSERLKKVTEKRFSNTCRNMSCQDKSLYLEETRRLQRLLFRTEHPVLSQPIPRNRGYPADSPLFGKLLKVRDVKF